MRHLITVTTPDQRITYIAIGNRDALIDAAIDQHGVCGITIRADQKTAPEVRNQFGYPVRESLFKQMTGFELLAPVVKQPGPQPESKFERARKYAAEAHARNTPPCDCEPCKQAEILPAVIQITTNWRNRK